MSNQLSKREVQVLELLLAGLMQKQIAHKLGISESRVQDVKSIIKKKWGVMTDIDFILTAIKKGYLHLEAKEEKESSNYTSNSSQESQFRYDYKPSTKGMVRVIFE